MPPCQCRVTGRPPPEDWHPGWGEVETLWMLPCLGVGALLTRGQEGAQAWVCFEPIAGTAESRAAGTAPPQDSGGARVGAALQGLAAAVRFGIWQALQAEGELYAGQIAAMCGAGPSAVSRVMEPLEQAGLVRVRRVGPAKFVFIGHGSPVPVPRPWVRSGRRCYRNGAGGLSPAPQGGSASPTGYVSLQAPGGGGGEGSRGEGPAMGPALAQAWLAAWERHILATADRRYCDSEMGEQIGWLVSPFLHGFYQGYLATGDAQWVDRCVDWADAWTRRGVQEPDGCIGWPKPAGASTPAVPDFVTDNLLGEAMGLRPMALLADVILKAPDLRARHGERARAYLALCEETYEKWDSRQCWREVPGGGVWVVPPFGIDPGTGRWTEGYARRATDGFTLPANKQNHIAMWLLALHDVTRRAVYRERAEMWFAVMKARMREREQGRYYVWNYWDPAGPWDRRADGSLKHWVGVHPNGGYYGIDVEGIVAAHEHGLVFDDGDITRLIATNRDFMWNHDVAHARFARIDGGEPDQRWKDSPGVLWHALLPHDATLRQVFEATHNPAGWGGLSATPWYLARVATHGGDTGASGEHGR